MRSRQLWHKCHRVLTGGAAKAAVIFSSVRRAASRQRILTGAANYTTDGYESMTANIYWADNSAQGSAKPTDVAIIAVLNHAKGEIATPVANVLRSALSTTISLPSHWTDDKASQFPKAFTVKNDAMQSIA